MTKEFLYSPWRMAYIQGEKPGDCVLCRHRDGSADDQNLIVHRGEHCYVMLNRYPYNNGHIMLVPYLHLSALADLPAEVLAELGKLTQLSELVLKEVYRCEGINLGLNLGKAAGAGIDEHLHMHLVPRWIGDCNFMSAVGGQRVIPEAFETSLARLRQGFANLLRGKE